MNDGIQHVEGGTSEISPTFTLDDAVALLLLSGPLVLAVTSLMLADFGLFSLRALSLIALPILIAGVIWTLSVTRRRLSVARGWLSCLLAVIVFSGLLLAPPYTYLHGGWDPGEYVSTAMNISRTGSLTIEDREFTQLSDASRRALMHEPNGARRTLQPGYLIEDEESGRIIPDYFHLYPAWLAVFSSCFGLHGTYWGHWIISILAAAMFFMTIRELFGVRAASIASLLLLCGPAQIYFGRFTSSEMLTRLFLFGAFYWYSRTMRSPRAAFDVLGGLSLAAAFLTHSTTVLPAAGILACLLLYALRRRNAATRRTLAVTAACLLLALARNAIMAPTMTAFLFGFVVGHPKLMLPAVILVAACATSVAVLLRRRDNRERGRDSFSDELFTRWIPGLLVALLLLFAYFLRPLLAPSENALNMQAIGWCVCPVSLVLFAIFFVRERWSSWSGGVSMLVCASAFTCVVLIAHKMAHPFLMWSLRRYVPIVVPFLVAIASVPLADLLFARSRLRQTGGAVLLILSLAYLAWASVPAFRVREHSGLPHLVEGIAEATANADFILCDHWRYSTPLRYAMGLPAYQFSRQPVGTDSGEAAALSESLVRKVLSGDTVYYVTVGNPFYHPAFKLVPVWEYRMTSETLVLTREKLPRSIRRRNEHVLVYQCVPHEHGEGVVDLFSGVEIDVGYHSMGLLKGFHKWRKAGDTGYRWTDGAGELYAPLRVPGPVPATIRMASGRPAGWADLPVTISVNGEEVTRFQVGRFWEEHSFALPADTQGAPAARLRISSPTWNPAKAGIAGYPDNLGVRIDWIRIGAEPLNRNGNLGSGGSGDGLSLIPTFAKKQAIAFFEET